MAGVFFMLGLGGGTTRGATSKAATRPRPRLRASLWVLMIGIIAVLSVGTLARRPASRK